MFRNILNYLTYVPKRLVAIVAMAVLVLAPVQSAFADNVRIEGRLAVANYTNQENQYQESTTAKPGDVVKFQVWYHNMEEPDSGKVAQNLKVGVDMPTTKGATKTATATISADGSNPVVDSATVNLSDANSYLEFIPGSVDWRHNAGTNDAPDWKTQNIGDNIVNHGQQFVENAQPCFNFQANITFFARVKVDQIDVDKTVRVVGEKDWKNENTAKPTDTLEYQIKVTNKGNAVLNNVLVGDNLPAYVKYVPGSTKILNSNHPNGDAVPSDNITTGGINIGNANPGGVTYMLFKATIEKDKLKQCGDYVLKNVAVTDSDQTGPFEDAVNTKVKVECKPGQPPVTTVTTPPTQLPNTGIEGPLAGILGSGSMGVAIRSFIRGRRSLKDALISV